MWHVPTLSFPSGVLNEEDPFNSPLGCIHLLLIKIARGKRNLLIENLWNLSGTEGRREKSREEVAKTRVNPTGTLQNSGANANFITSLRDISYEICFSFMGTEKVEHCHSHFAFVVLWLRCEEERYFQHIFPHR